MKIRQEWITAIRSSTSRGGKKSRKVWWINSLGKANPYHALMQHMHFDNTNEAK